MSMDDVIVATGISLLSTASSDSGLNVDYGSLFQPIVDGCLSAIAKMLPIIIPIFAVPFLIEVVLYVVRLICDRKAAEEQAFWDEVTREGTINAEDIWFYSTYSDEELDPIYEELSGALDFGVYDDD